MKTSRLRIFALAIMGAVGYTSLILDATEILKESSIQQGEHPALETALDRPSGLALTESGILYISTFGDGRIHRLNLKTGQMKTLVTQSPIVGPGNILLDQANNLIVANPFQCRIVRIDLNDGSVTTIVGKEGDPMKHPCGRDGDHGPALKASSEPDFISQDGLGNLFIVDGYPNASIRRVEKASTIITTVVPSTKLVSATTVAVTKNSTLFVSQVGNNSHRPILAGDATTGVLNPLKKASFSGNKDIWTKLKGARRIFADNRGNLYLLDDSRVLYIDFSDHFVSVLAGTTKGFAGDGGPAIDAQMFWPQSVVADPLGNLYIADSENQRIRKIDAKTHIITTIAGNGGPSHTPGTIEFGR